MRTLILALLVLLVLSSVSQGSHFIRRILRKPLCDEFPERQSSLTDNEVLIRSPTTGEISNIITSIEIATIIPSHGMNTLSPTRSLSKAFRLGFYFFLWYFFTVVYNVSNKRVLNDLPLPATVAAIQIIIGIPVFLPVWLIKRPNFDAFKSVLPALCKIGFCHALGNLATVVSLSQGAVSFTHIIKAAEPIFSAVLSASIYGDYSSTSVYLSLIPIVFGVALASVRELSFTWTGFLAGMASNLFYQLRIVLSKKELTNESNSLSPANFFRVLTIISAVELLPISIALEGYKLRSVWELAIANGVDMDNLISNILISGFSSYCYNEVSFWILGSISPMTHAVGNTIKRVVIIMASIMILKSSISTHGVVGSVIAILGTLLYSFVGHRASQLDQRKITQQKNLS